MARKAKHITAQVLGGEAIADLSAETVEDLFEELDLDGDYAATINGEPASMDDELCDYNFVSFSPAVKGGNF